MLIQRILSKRVIALSLLGLVLFITACSGTTTHEGPVKTPDHPGSPVNHPSPRVDPGHDTQNVTYHGGHVIDGTANIYVIFWEDPHYQKPTPKYIDLLTRFFQDVGSSPLYANLSQYTDSRGLAPTGARLAGTFTDTQAFPPGLMSLITDPSHPDSGYYWHQEIMDVATSQGWDFRNLHNFFFVFPIANLGCGSHGFLGDRPEEKNITNGSPTAVGYYPYADGQEACVVSPYSPNNDHIADIAIGIASHELMEAVADPYIDGWGEIADKCFLPPGTIDPITHANVVWKGHPYLIQEEWDNSRNGCVLEGP